MERRRLGPWRRGERFGSIVADHETGWDDDDNVRAYGGHMVCESLASDDIASLIAAAPDLLAVCKDIREFLKRSGYDTTLVNTAIAKAEGRS